MVLLETNNLESQDDQDLFVLCNPRNYNKIKAFVEEIQDLVFVNVRHCAISWHKTNIPLYNYPEKKNLKPCRDQKAQKIN